MVNGELIKPGGSKEYSKLLASLEKDFREKKHSLKKGPRGDVVLSDFLKEKRETDLKNLTQTDNALTAKEKEAKILEDKNKQKELQNKAKEKVIEEMKVSQEKMTEHFNKVLEKQKKEFEKQNEKEKNKMEKQFKEMLKQHDDALQTGFKTQTELLKQQLKDIKYAQYNVDKNKKSRNREENSMS